MIEVGVVFVAIAKEGLLQEQLVLLLLVRPLQAIVDDEVLQSFRNVLIIVLRQELDNVAVLLLLDCEVIFEEVLDHRQLVLI